MRIKMALWMLAIAATGSLLSCDDTSDDAQDSAYPNMDGATAECEFSVVSFKTQNGAIMGININDLPVADLQGAEKVSETTWEVVSRRGVRFSDIFAKVGMTTVVADDTPVNCVARDGFDPLRTKLGFDTSKLPTFAFLREYGYVYVGSPGDKDPLYPTMEGKSLIVDYNIGSDAEVPAYLGGTIASLGMFRWKMVEQIDDTTRGIFELGPIVE